MTAGPEHMPSGYVGRMDAAGPAGTLSVAAGRPVLACAEGALELLVVQPPGRRAMSGEDYVRGMHGRGQ